MSEVAAAAVGAALSSILSSFGSQEGSTGPRDITSQSTTKLQTLNPQIVALLEGVIKSGQYSKAAAMQDSAAVVQATIQNALRKELPSIASASKSAGMSGDSMTSILANQAAANAAIQGAGVKLDTITNYNNNFNSLIQSLIAGSPKVQESKGSTHDSGQSTKSSKSLCFITTIVCKYLGKSDDCNELNTLRWFRDEYALKQPHDSDIYNDVKLYNEAAPIYTAVLDALPTARAQYLYKDWYDEYILPAVNNTIAGEYEAAYARYKHLFIEVKTLVEQELHVDRKSTRLNSSH